VRVGGESKTLGSVELFRASYQALHSILPHETQRNENVQRSCFRKSACIRHLNKIRELHPGAFVFFCNRDYKPHVRFHHPVLAVDSMIQASPQSVLIGSGCCRPLGKRWFTRIILRNLLLDGFQFQEVLRTFIVRAMRI
jgi:hypothetical protein